MTQVFTFISGIMIGVYIDQNYKLPKIDIILTKSIEYLKGLEKNDK